ncbi:hypothetical protein IEQ34_013686 [Dendrobium chrysotoxum]|uniref:Uncharacterized protein n=1 Tax=Dendrobium chrysotoxum TaxID=161865 RepID=A0AAV7GP73_DENCH|nr:hypothetical protein IEQ34_013686 [Dendrobium chrysotoxum]
MGRRWGMICDVRAELSINGREDDIKLLLKFSFGILTNLLNFLILRQSFEYFSQAENTRSTDSNLPNICNINKPPLTEEIEISSATELVNAGISLVTLKLKMLI